MWELYNQKPADVSATRQFLITTLQLQMFKYKKLRANIFDFFYTYFFYLL